MPAKKPKTQTRQDKKHAELMAGCATRYQARCRDAQHQAMLRAQRIAENTSWSAAVIEPSSTWHAEPMAAKNSIFHGTDLRHIDVEAVNARRFMLGLGDIVQAEHQARQQVVAKSQRVAVICPKSGYQYLGAGEQARDLGRKTSQL